MKSHKNLSTLVLPVQDKGEKTTTTDKRSTKKTSKGDFFSCNKFTFPILPASVSDQDISEMKKKNSNDEQNINNQQEQGCYGWFVKVDLGDNVGHIPNPYAQQSTSRHSSFSSDTAGKDLAFTASTAPIKCTNHDADVEWAKAADTVDEVLGDFF